MRERANKELVLIAACLIAVCLVRTGAAKRASAQAAAPDRPAKFFELVDRESSLLMPLTSAETAKKIDARCPEKALSGWDRVELSEQGCRVESGSASGFARLAAGKKISLNAASAQELAVVPGIGEKRAQKILELKEDLGGFKNFEQLGGLKWFNPEMREETERFFKID
jgi:competence ComEA-like helix-hairpin-helix protein